MKILEQLNRNGVICAGGVILHPKMKDHIAIVNQKGTSWSLPKGHVEKGENLIAAAKREIYEETGIQDLVFLEELGSYERTALKEDGSEDSSELKTIYLFLFKTKTKKLAPLDLDNPTAKWVHIKKCFELLSHHKDKAFFSDYILPKLVFSNIEEK